MQRKFVLGIILLCLCGSTAHGQPGDALWEYHVSTYPIAIKKKQYLDSVSTNYQVYYYSLDGQKATYIFDSVPSEYNTWQTPKHLFLRFDTHTLFGNGKPLDLFITNNRKDTMHVHMTGSDFIACKGFIDTISFMDGNYKLSTIQEIKANRDRMSNAIINRSVLEGEILSQGWWRETSADSRVKFISEDKIVYYPAPSWIMDGSTIFSRNGTSAIFDTLLYESTNDSIRLSSAFSKEFLSKQETWIQPYAINGVSTPGSYMIWFSDRKSAKQHQKILSLKDDTLNVSINTEPLLYRNCSYHHLEIFIDDSLVLSDERSADYDFQFIGNFIKSYSDSVVVKTIFSYSYTNADTTTIMNSFSVKGYGQMYLKIGISYKTNFQAAPFSLLLIRGRRLYFEGNQFDLKQGILPRRGYYLIP